MSMTIRVSASGDIVHLPHKDLLEHVLREANEAIEAAIKKAGPSATAFTRDNGTERRSALQARPLSGNTPYFDWGTTHEADASWTVHLPDPK